MESTQFTLVVMGSGAGASHIYNGQVSSSFMLLANNQPFCLVDLGLGVGQKVVETFGGFPTDIVITHNHSDHAGDLAVVLRVEQAKQKACRVFAHTQVSQRLQQHRVAEHLEQISADNLANWMAPEQGDFIPLAKGLSIAFYPGVHSETSFGFIIKDEHQRLRLSYTGDSQLNTALYQTLSQADVFIMDARPDQNAWHADFKSVEPWLKTGCYILGHGLSQHQAQTDYTDYPLLLENQRLSF